MQIHAQHLENVDHRPWPQRFATEPELLYLKLWLWHKSGFSKGFYSAKRTHSGIKFKSLMLQNCINEAIYSQQPGKQNNLETEGKIVWSLLLHFFTS